LVLPPEIHSSLMYAGAGSAPMLAAAASWDGLAYAGGVASYFPTPSSAKMNTGALPFLEHPV
jgi:hypothetical protein